MLSGKVLSSVEFRLDKSAESLGLSVAENLVDEFDISRLGGIGGGESLGGSIGAFRFNLGGKGGGDRCPNEIDSIGNCIDGNGAVTLDAPGLPATEGFKQANAPLLTTPIVPELKPKCVLLGLEL